MVGSSFPSELLIWSFHYWFVEAYPTVCDPMDCSTPGFPVLHYLPEFAQHMSIELVMPSNHLVLCGPLLLLQSFPASGSFQMSQLFTSGCQSIVCRYIFFICLSIRSDQISRSVISDSLRPPESQHARPPCPSPTPGVHSDSHPSSQ